MGQWDTKAFARSLTWEQLMHWLAYYEMSDFIAAETSRGDSGQAALAKWAAIQEIQAEVREQRMKRK